MFQHEKATLAGVLRNIYTNRKLQERPHMIHLLCVLSLDRQYSYWIYQVDPNSYTALSTFHRLRIYSAFTVLKPSIGVQKRGLFGVVGRSKRDPSRFFSLFVCHSKRRRKASHDHNTVRTRKMLVD